MTSILHINVRCVTMGGGPGGLDPHLFPQKGKSALILLVRSTYNQH